MFDYGELEINPSQDDRTLQIIIDGKSYKLPEVGSGLTQFILVLGNEAFKQPSYILIDEPELNLHPSLQLDFLTTLGAYAREGVIFGTHSIGLARASAQRIYTVRKIAPGTSEVKEYEVTPGLTELLGELSFSGYRELGFNQVLLVEGPTDVTTLQQFLRLYKLDHQIVILPFYGDYLIRANPDVIEAQLEEMKRIPADISVLIDSERTTLDAPLESKRAQFVEICKKAGIQSHVLKRRAIENYFSDEAVKKKQGPSFRALQPYEKLKDLDPTWGKSENWRIAREMTLSEL